MITVTSYQHSPCAPILPLPIRRRRKMETGKVFAAWGYDYEHNGESISFVAGEKFDLVEKSNDDWWLVSRIPGKKFFAPAKYLKEETTTEKVQKPQIITPKPQSPKLTAKLRANSGGDVEKRKLKPAPNPNHRRSTTVSKKFVDVESPEFSPIKGGSTFSYPALGSASGFKDELNKINRASRKLPSPPTTNKHDQDLSSVKETIIHDDFNYDRLEPIMDELYETVQDPADARTNWHPRPAPRTEFSESDPTPRVKPKPGPSPPPRNHKLPDNSSPDLNSRHKTTDNTFRTNETAPRHTRRSTISSAHANTSDRPSMRPKSIEDANNIRNCRVLPPVPNTSSNRSASLTEEQKSNLQYPCPDLSVSMPGFRDASNSFSPSDSPTNPAVSTAPAPNKGLFTLGTMQFEKRGNVSRYRKDAGIFKGGKWDAQYMMLENFALYFYKDSKVARSDSSQSQLTMELQYYYIYLVPDTKEKKNVFRLVEQETGEETLIQAENTAGMNEWFSVIQTTISQCSQSPRKISIPEIADPAPESRIDEKKKDRLRKFLRQRPNIETLQKKGILRYSVFGSPLESVVEKERQNIPDFMCRCILEVETRGLDVMGIYRLAGNTSLIQKLRCIVDQEQLYNLADLDKWDDINIITGALKLFLREMPEPLVPFSDYQTFMEAAYISDTKERVDSLRNMFNSFPKPNYDLFHTLCSHLQVVVQESDVNKMKASNLAIVFGPTLVRPEIDTASTIGHFTAINNSLEFVFTHFSEIFNKR